MEFSSEDALRLNVLLSTDLEAIRIDESKMIVYGLSQRGEAKVQLNPTGRDEPYLRLVRETISGHVLGSPGGYPIFLRRWTRMGQAKDENLDKLLLLGEPEAVTAVVCAPGLTDDLARRAWWAAPNAENARRMLQREAVVAGAMGKELAEFLIEFLAFEEDPRDQMESVRLVQQPGLIDAATRDKLWAQGKRKTAYLVGFLQATPDALPDPLPARADAPALAERLTPLAEAGNPYASALLRVASGPGQTFLAAIEQVLAKPANQDVVNSLLDTIADYFAPVRPHLPEEELDKLMADASVLCDQCPPADVGMPAGLPEMLAAAPELRPDLCAMLCLARLSYAVVRPIFSRTDAIGSLMRRKLEPVSGPLLSQVTVLRTARY